VKKNLVSLKFKLRGKYPRKRLILKLGKKKNLKIHFKINMSSGERINKKFLSRKNHFIKKIKLIKMLPKSRILNLEK
jgi:hypothetical protein